MKKLSVILIILSLFAVPAFAAHSCGQADTEHIRCELKELKADISFLNLFNALYMTESQMEALLVDINQADWPELAQLPGVGKTLAQRIIRARTDQGPFRNRQQLLDVPGIGPSTLARIEPYLSPFPTGDD